MEQHPKAFEFMQIAMKYLPEAKTQLDELGIELAPEKLQPMISLLTKVMAEAYELGKEEAKHEV
ncbi:ComZ family protein [Bacillus alveayuensis]|jgi:competence protein ComZ|uniref:Competence protein ComZ n=1 Tax=Aeribacillus alveayuensis TaxID=279215 RepID=A0ABT9VN70_9BACI|nr:ComZ family protein [Bacillus alveayuensis]MDQ0162430.1 competence protein ComZ [Bacillus alveayuensis]